MSLSMVQIRNELRNEIALMMQATANKMASGRAVDFPDYKGMVGRVAGNREAMDAVDKVFAKYLNDEGEDKE